MLKPDSSIIFCLMMTFGISIEVTQYLNAKIQIVNCQAKYLIMSKATEYPTTSINYPCVAFDCLKTSTLFMYTIMYKMYAMFVIRIPDAMRVKYSNFDPLRTL